jgi:hypothetical protein
MKHSKVLLLLSSLLAGIVLLPKSVVADHSWNGYHWPISSLPVLLNVGNAVSAAWDPYLAEAISDWNDSSVIHLTEVPSSGNPRTCKAVSGRMEVCNAAYGNTGWLGVAQVWVSGLHIAQATTKLNDTYFADPFYNTPAWRRLVTCQEIAHDFGLDHQDETFDNENLGSCMDYTDDPDGSLGDQLSNEHPNAHDYAELREIYDHIDTGGGGGGGGGGNGRGRGASARDIFPTPGDQRLEFDHPYQWGRQLRANAHVALFDADLGNDNHVFTFVIWAR